MLVLGYMDVCYTFQSLGRPVNKILRFMCFLITCQTLDIRFDNFPIRYFLFWIFESLGSLVNTN